MDLDNTITVELPNGTPEVLNFDYLVLCTGFSYASPIKSEHTITIKDRTKILEENYEKFRMQSLSLLLEQVSLGVK